MCEGAIWALSPWHGPLPGVPATIVTAGLIQINDYRGREQENSAPVRWRARMLGILCKDKQ